MRGSGIHLLTILNLWESYGGNVCKAFSYRHLSMLVVERSSELSNQIVKDFKEIADLTYLIPMMEGEKQSNTPLDKEA